MLCSPLPTPLPLDSTHDCFGEDDDAALQAVLLASLCQSAVTSEEVAAEAAAQEKLLQACTRPDLVAFPVPLSAHVTEPGFSESARKVLLALADGQQHFQLCRIRGDGHCLFRAIAASLTLQAAW